MTPSPPLRILFVFAELADGGEEAEVRLLARHLDPARYRLEVVACFRGDALPDETGRRLAALGVHVDTAPYALSFEETVAYLARRLTDCDIVVSCQNVADIYPALERLHLRPPLIERGRLVAEALAGPKHLTARYVGACRRVRDAAAARMPGRAHHAVEIPLPVSLSPVSPSPLPPAAVEPAARARHAAAAVPAWRALFDAVLAERPPAPPPGLFASVLQGGWECSSHRLPTGRRLDILASTGHDANAAADYRQLADLGLRTQRDGLRWHRIETTPGRHDFASWRPMLAAARDTGTEVIWDLLHYGWPDDLDVWSPAFVARFAAFARAAARLHREESDAVPFWCPVNEISFLAWAGGDAAYLNPFARGRGFELKVQLARAAIAATHVLREVDARARFLLAEPLVAIHHDPATGRPRADAEGAHDAQFQAADLVAGRLWPQIGGDPSLLDIVGANYYPTNQWIHGGARIDPGHSLYRPLPDLLVTLYARTGRPIVISETGTEGDARAPWFASVAAGVTAARARGVPVEGICLYPVANHLGWDDDRLCENGLLGHLPVDGTRAVDERLLAGVRAASARPAARPAPGARRAEAGGLR